MSTSNLLKINTKTCHPKITFGQTLKLRDQNKGVCKNCRKYEIIEVATGMSIYPRHDRFHPICLKCRDCGGRAMVDEAGVNKGYNIENYTVYISVVKHRPDECNVPSKEGFHVITDEEINKLFYVKGENGEKLPVYS